MSVPVLTVIDSGHTIADDGATLPTVVIDASDHPSVADLARVHAIEGVGDIRTEFARTGNVVVLAVQLTSPVTATFAIAIDLETHGRVLADAAEAESLVIAHTDPTHAASDRPLWLALDLDRDALRRALAAEPQQ